jgi:hypothetical protein
VNELTNENGVVCVSVDVVQLDSESWAIRVSWKRGVGGHPDAQAWNDAITSSLSDCDEKGARFIESRVITASDGVAGYETSYFG